MSGDEENSVSAEDTEIDPDAEGEEDFRPFDEIADEYQPSVIRKVMGDDGLPMLVPPEKSDIPALSKETLICMGDYSSFVLRDSFGEVRKTFSSEEVVQKPNGRWYPLEDFQVEVEPIRPPCKHYVRQVSQFELNAEHKTHSRLCSARRTTEGAFMSVRDSGMWACSMREPRHPASEHLIRDFDELKIKQGAAREFHSIFSTPSQLKEPENA